MTWRTLKLVDLNAYAVFFHFLVHKAHTFFSIISIHHHLFSFRFLWAVNSTRCPTESLLNLIHSITGRISKRKDMTPQNEQVSASTRNVYGMRHLDHLFFGSLSSHAAWLALWLGRVDGNRRFDQIEGLRDDIC